MFQTIRLCKRASNERKFISEKNRRKSIKIHPKEKGTSKECCKGSSLLLTENKASRLLVTKIYVTKVLKLSMLQFVILTRLILTNWLGSIAEWP